MSEEPPRPEVNPERTSPIDGSRPRIWLHWLLGATKFLTFCLAFAIVGLAGGLIVGARHAILEVAALPAVAKPTLGMESGGFTPFVIWAASLLFHGAAGLVIGLLAGLVIIPIVALVNRLTRRPTRPGR